MPSGAAMSRPECRWPGRGSPNKPVIGPLTGQISWPEPCLIGCGAPCRAPATRACSAWSEARSSIAPCFSSRTCDSVPRLSARAERQLVARRHELALRRGDLVALLQDALGGQLLALLELGQLYRLALRQVAQAADTVRDLSILIGNALEEVGRGPRSPGHRPLSLAWLDSSGVRV